MSLTTMSAWHDVARHPWYAPTSLKRKHSDSEEEDDTFLRGSSQSPDSDTEHGVAFGYPTPPPDSTLLVFSEPDPEHDAHGHGERKRRRYGEIERRMARMHIAPPLGLAPNVSASSEASWYTAGSTSPVSRAAVLDAYAVEEPPSPEYDGGMVPLLDTCADAEAPPIHEVRMRGAEPAWYEREKDRIVITDLDEAAREAEDEYKSEAEPHPDSSEYADSNADYSISSLLLEHIKKQANFPYVPPSPDDGSRKGALVLFRPPPVTFFSRPGASEEELREEDRCQEARREAADGVRVEEIDVDAANYKAPPGGYVTGTVSELNGIDEPMEMDVDI